MTLGEAVQAARTRLVAAGIASDTAARDAALLARHALGIDHAAFLARTRDPADEAWRRAFDDLVDRRAAREPIAYIRGVQEFWGREFLVSPAVLIPRPETELIIEEALAWRRDGYGRTVRAPAIVDVGTGSGCLAVTIAAEWPDVNVVATDISGPALVIAAHNARRHGVDDRVTFLEGAYLDPVDGVVDLVLANPPYVPQGDAAGLQPEVVAHEPATALFGGGDGLRDIRALVVRASERLSPRGVMLMEIGAGQEASVIEAVGAMPALSLARIRCDLQGIARMAVIDRG